MNSEQESELLEWLGVDDSCPYCGKANEANSSFAIIKKMREKGYEYDIVGWAAGMDKAMFTNERFSRFRGSGYTPHAAIKQAAYNAMREENTSEPTQ